MGATYKIISELHLGEQGETCSSPLFFGDKMPRNIIDIVYEFIDALEFDALIKWADLLGVEHEEKMWFDDEWPDRENNLRVDVGEAMACFC